MFHNALALQLLDIEVFSVTLQYAPNWLPSYQSILISRPNNLQLANLTGPGLSPPHLLSHPGLLSLPFSFLAAPSEVPSPTSKHWGSSFFRFLSWTHFSLNTSIHPIALSTIQKDNSKTCNSLRPYCRAPNANS